MVHLSEDIHSMTDFKRRTTDFVARLKETGRPMVLTTNGRAEVVVQDAAAYQRLLDAARNWEMHETVRKKLADVPNRRSASGNAGA